MVEFCNYESVVKRALPGRKVTCPPNLQKQYRTKENCESCPKAHYAPVVGATLESRMDTFVKLIGDDARRDSSWGRTNR